MEVLGKRLTKVVSD